MCYLSNIIHVMYVLQYIFNYYTNELQNMKHMILFYHSNLLKFPVQCIYWCILLVIIYSEYYGIPIMPDQDVRYPLMFWKIVIDVPYDACSIII